MSYCVAGFVFSSRARSKRTSRRTIQVVWSRPSSATMLPAGNLPVAVMTARSPAEAVKSVGVAGEAETSGKVSDVGASVDTLDRLLSGLGLLLGVVADVLLAIPDHLLLELEDAVDQSFRRRRAAGHVDVDRDDLVDALHHVVGAVEAAGAGAGSHGDHPLGVRHLVVDLL